MLSSLMENLDKSVTEHNEVRHYNENVYQSPFN